MAKFEFLVIDGLYESAEVVKINRGTESDAWYLINEELPTNHGIPILLTDKIKSELKACLK